MTPCTFHSLTLFRSQLILSWLPSLLVKHGQVEAIKYRSPIAFNMSSIDHSSTPTGSFRILSPEHCSSATMMPCGLASSTRLGNFQLSGQNIGVPVIITLGVSGAQTQSFRCALFSNSSHKASVFSVHRRLSSHTNV